jgi:hypothetical protein
MNIFHVFVAVAIETSRSVILDLHRSFGPKYAETDREQATRRSGWGRGFRLGASRA